MTNIKIQKIRKGVNVKGKTVCARKFSYVLFQIILKYFTKVNHRYYKKPYEKGVICMYQW